MSNLRDYFDPTRIYNTSIAAGRMAFLWGLLLYPFAALFVLLGASIIIIEALSAGTDPSDIIGIVTYIFMLLWVTAAVCVTYRRLDYLRMSRRWVWLIILPPAYLILCLYLMVRSK
jgi:uncharacterized membrane protein YhaH (DUF805 family)